MGTGGSRDIAPGRTGSHPTDPPSPSSTATTTVPHPKRLSVSPHSSPVKVIHSGNHGHSQIDHIQNSSHSISHHSPRHNNHHSNHLSPNDIISSSSSSKQQDPSSSSSQVVKNPQEEEETLIQSPQSRSSSSSSSSSSSQTQKKGVPLIHFTWPSHASQVFLVGSWSDWTHRQELIPSSKDESNMNNPSTPSHYTTVELQPGVYDYKYIVDGEWKCDSTAPIRTDPHGWVNNVIEVHQPPPDPIVNDHKSSIQHSNNNSSPSTTTTNTNRRPTITSNNGFLSCEPDEDGILYGTVIPEAPSEDTPPTLPPQLQRSLLNDRIPGNPRLLPVPQHVMLNHLYTIVENDSMVVLGCTARYGSKFVSTVYYKPQITPR